MSRAVLRAMMALDASASGTVPGWAMNDETHAAVVSAQRLGLAESGPEGWRLTAEGRRMLAGPAPSWI